MVKHPGWLVRLLAAVSIVAGLVASAGFGELVRVQAASAQVHEDEVVDDVDEDDERDTDEGADELVGIEDNTYESPTWGYSIEWDEDVWEAVEATSEDEVDELILQSRSNTLYFSATNGYEGDPEACLADWATVLSSEEGVADWEPLEDEDGEVIEGEEEDRAWAAFWLTFTDSAGNEFEDANYIECRTLVEDEATLTIVHLTALADYFDEAELVAEVLDTIELSGDGDQPDEDLLADVETYEIDDLSHTDEDVDYDPVPPVGGPHDAVWQNCGFYDEPVRDENAAHSLEHGAVWITYDPDLPEDEVEILEELADDHVYVLVSPYPDLPAPVVASAWGVQLLLDGTDDPRLEAFVDFYEAGPQTPEPGAPCTGGTSATED